MQNILLVGTDFADPDSVADDPATARTDTIILMHIPSSQDRAYLVSIPRDLWVPVPQKATDTQCGSRRAKVNAAYAWGDLPLLVKTVECVSSVRIDHVVTIDFGGFKQVVDALGGIDMPIERDITSIHEPFRKFTKGTMHLNGVEALDYVRQRKQFPDGDFARMRHQQQLLKVLLDKAASGETLTNPVKFNSFVNAMTKAVKVDQDFSLLDMALQFRGLRSDDLAFLTSPFSGTDDIGGQSVVVSDRPRAIALYNAIAADKMAEWAGANLPPAPKSSAGTQ
jgi:LCP family protein required for cell wall assembly